MKVWADERQSGIKVIFSIIEISDINLRCWIFQLEHYAFPPPMLQIYCLMKMVCQGGTPEVKGPAVVRSGSGWSELLLQVETY